MQSVQAHLDVAAGLDEWPATPGFGHVLRAESGTGRQGSELRKRLIRLLGGSYTEASVNAGASFLISLRASAFRMSTAQIMMTT